jgi:hypothetical protein
VKFLGFAILLGPTMWALIDAIRRPHDGFPTGRKVLWILTLIVGSGTMFFLIPPVAYLLLVRLKGGPPKSTLLSHDAHPH